MVTYSARRTSEVVYQPFPPYHKEPFAWGYLPRSIMRWFILQDGGQLYHENGKSYAQ